MHISMEQNEMSIISRRDEEGNAIPVETPPSTHLSETSDAHSVQTTSDPRSVVTPQKNTPLFRQSKISIALDVSGSTFGLVLQAELKAVRGICSLFPAALRPTIKILPWSDYAQRPISLDQIDELDSDGGTDPSCLLHDDACRYELQNSSFWFLITDGDILDPDVRGFAKNLVNYGLHGLASVVAIFGERQSMPSKCNISVGLSVFAVSPHCAFLYTDVETGHTYILQTKGCFSALLPKEAKNPILGPDTRWTDLPRTSYENLSRVPIPPPQSASKDEVILMNDMKINLSALLSSSSVDPQIASQILDNEDNIKTIALTAKLKGQSEQFRKWLDNVEKMNVDTLNPDKIERPQNDDKSDLLTEAMAYLMVDEKPSDSVTELQRELSKANTKDVKALETMVDSVAEISHRRTSSMSHARRVSSSSLIAAEDNIGSFDYSSRNQQSASSGTPFLTGELAPIPQTPGVRPDTHNKSLMNPGFQKPNFQKDFYKGQCMLCTSSEYVMALLLKKPSGYQETITANFPQPGGSSHLRFPLTMGNYPETDIILPLLACDPCSFRIVKKGRLPSGDEISAALPLLSFSKNRAAWLGTINIATQKRFNTEDLPLVFLAILYTKLERLLEERDSRKTVALRPALNWACGMLLQEVQLVDAGCFQKNPLCSVILRLFHSTLDSYSAIGLLIYPIDGFIVANVALSNSQYKTQISGQKRSRVVFYRFLYHLTEQYFKFRSESGEMVLQATMMLILILDERASPRSLLTLESLRQISMNFSNRKEMMQALQSHLNWRPRKFKPKRLSVSVKDLLDTPFLDLQSLRHFRRLGSLFIWIEDKAAHAIAAFLHHLYCMESTAASPRERFIEIRKNPEMDGAMSKPEEVSAKKVEDLIKNFPPVL